MQKLLAAYSLFAFAALAAPLPTQTDTRLPYTFEENRGQTNSRVQYLARGKGYTLYLTGRESVLSFSAPGQKAHALRMAVHGMLPGSAPQPLAPLEQTSNYFIGEQHISGARHFSSVRYPDVYQGVDLIYHSRENELEYDFVVHPGAAVSRIALDFSGADTLRVNPVGELEIRMGDRTLIHRKPYAYQDVAGQRLNVAAEYQVTGNRVSFRTAAYDPAHPLVIDPVVIYSTYLGGDRSESINAVAVDKNGNVYLAGETTSGDFPIVGTNHTEIQGALTYGFVTKINAKGDQILYSSFLGGSSSTRAHAIAVDADGNAYVGGTTGATNFPLKDPTQSVQTGLNIGFITKLSPDGKDILFSTFHGGERNDDINALAIDPNRNIYITGNTGSQTFPLVNPFQSQLAGNGDIFVAKFAAPNYRVAYSSYLGGTGFDEAYGIAADAQGNAYITGTTVSSTLATAGAFQTKYGGGNDAYLAKIKPAGDGLAFFTYYGGQLEEYAQAIAIHGDGSVWITGSTASSNLPLAGNAVQGQRNNNLDAFVASFDTSGAQLRYSTYLGGSGFSASHTEEGRGIGFDPQGHIIITGVTTSPDFPAVRAVQGFGGGPQDAFIASLDPSAGSIVYSTPLGGNGVDLAHALAVDATGGIVAAGQTESANFPLVAPLRSTLVSATEAFLTKLCDPFMVAGPNAFTFTFFPGGAPPPAQTLNLSTCAAIPFSLTTNGSFFTVSSTTGITNATLQVSVNPAGLQPGKYEGSITVAAPEAVNNAVTIPVVLNVAPPPPVITAAGIVNAASGQGGSVSPGELIVIYGANMAADQFFGSELEGTKVKTQLQNTRILFDGQPAPLIYISKLQASAIVPYSVAGKPTTSIEVEYLGVRSNVLPVNVTSAVPGLFTANASGTGPGAILNQNSSLNTAANPEVRGNIIVLFTTGEGQTDPGGIDGQLALESFPKPLVPVRVLIDGLEAEVVYAGAAPTLVAGVMQVNAKVPQGVHPGAVSVDLIVGEAHSKEGVTVTIQ